MNVSKNTINACQEMIRESFIANARVDRMKSVMGAKLAYNNTADVIHLQIAHAYAGIYGDLIGDKALEGYNIDVIYGNIPEENKDYQTPAQILYELRDLTIDYQNKLNMCARIAFDNMDLHVFADLMEIIAKHNQVVRATILLVDKIDLYGVNPSFDAHIKEHFNLLGGE